MCSLQRILITLVRWGNILRNFSSAFFKSLAQMIKDFIRKLEICDADKTKLMNLKPEDYLGLAERLVKDELKKK